jgi:hypothetical protein
MLTTDETLSNTRMNNYLLKVTCFFWLLAKLIGWRLFTLYRTFPSAPVFEGLNRIPAAVHAGLYLVSLSLLVVLLGAKKNRLILCCLLVTEICSCLLDQNRLRAWEYQCVFIVFIFILNARNQKLVTVAFAFILASTYFYSGLGKLNPGFLQNIWTRMVLEMFLKLPRSTASLTWLHYSGYTVGCIELLAGAGLLFPLSMKTSAKILIAMHLLILIWLGPLGLHYNRIVWPWNLAMIGYLYLLFLKKDSPVIYFGNITTGWNKVILIFWGILPALNIFGYWDSDLSLGMYSGNIPGMVICIRDTSKCRPIKKFFREDKNNICNGCETVNLQYWAMLEMGVGACPELRVYRKFQLKLEKEYPAAGISCIYFADGKRLP